LPLTWSELHACPQSIKRIAENGHVVTPRFGGNGVEVVPIGIRDASTFPGFCDIHEAQFAEFESQKKMTTTDHFHLQAYRTLCREIYTKQHYKRKLEASLDDYRGLRGAFITARVSQVQREKPIGIKGVRFEHDPLEDSVIEQIESLSQGLKELDELYNGILDELRTGAGRVVMIGASLDFELPVCLSGLGILPYRTGDVIRRALCFLAVIPEANETKIIVGTGKDHENELTRYLQDESSTAMLARVESWMCHGSDHWFMTPSVWEAIPPERKDAIRARILDTAHSIAHPVEFSVLDGLRNRIVAWAESQLRDRKIAPDNISRAMQLVDAEKAKLNWVGPQTCGGKQA
jgi:hypothetical protein